MKELLKNTKQVSKITVGGTYLSINTLNINELKSSSKKHEVYKQKKKNDQRPVSWCRDLSQHL